LLQVEISPDWVGEGPEDVVTAGFDVVVTVVIVALDVVTAFVEVEEVVVGDVLTSPMTQ